MNDEFGGVLVEDKDEFGGVAVDALSTKNKPTEASFLQRLGYGITHPEWNPIKIVGGILNGVESGVAGGLNSLLNLSARVQGLPQYTTENAPYQAGQPTINIPAAHDPTVAPVDAALLQMLEGLTTPGNIVMLPLAAGRTLVNRGVQAAFSSQMIPAAVQEGGQALDSSLPNDVRQQAAVRSLVNGILGPLLMKSAMTRPLLPPGPANYKFNENLYRPTEPSKLRLEDVPENRDIRFDEPGGGDVVPSARQLPLWSQEQPINVLPSNTGEGRAIYNMPAGRQIRALIPEESGLTLEEKANKTSAEAVAQAPPVTDVTERGGPPAPPDYQVPSDRPVIPLPGKLEGPEVVNYGTSRFKNPQGDPVGTTYRATAEDFQAYGEAQKGISEVLKNDPKLEQPDSGAKIQALMQENERVKNKYGGMPPEAPISRGLQTKIKPGQGSQTGAGLNLATAAYDKLQDVGESLTKLARSAPNRERVSQLLDAADNQSKIMARQVGNRTRIALSNEIDRQAMSFIIETGGDKGLLDVFAKKVVVDPLATKLVRYARANFNRILPHAQAGKYTLDQQRQIENAVNLNVDEAPNYIKHTYEDRKATFFDPGGHGISTSFKAQRTFATLADAIAAGEKPSTYDAAVLIESRLAAGLKMVQRIQWGEALGKITDPTTGNPITAPMVTQPKGTQVAPKGYQPREILPGVRVAVQDGYTGILDALLGKSFVSNSLVGRLALQTEGFIKHGLLMVDTFHASRVLQKELFLTGQIGYNKGVSALEYDQPTLQRLVSRGDITQEDANWINSKRATTQKLLSNGLNVGRLAEAIYSDVVRKEIKVLGKDINFPGRFNKWVFDKVTRGAMLESALFEFDRTKKNNPSWSDDQVASHVSKQINVFFGNLGRQGILKSASAQDLARLIFLAPQWVEGMVQTELRAVKQGLEVPYDLATEQTLKVGTAAKGVGTGLLAYFIGTQLLNKYTTGHFTWENKDKDHKLDAYIPDPTGKSGGYWVSPFSVAGEVTHDWLRYSNSKQNQLEVAAQILSNKMSPLARSEETLRTGRDFTGAKILGTGERLKQAGKALLPVPLPFAGATSDQPGATGRQLLGSVGLKVEIAGPKEKKLDDAAKAKYGKEYSLLSLAEKAKVNKEQSKEERTLQQTYSIAQKATDKQFSVAKEINEGISKGSQDFLKRNKLSLGVIESYVTKQGVRVSLSKEDYKSLVGLTIKKYDEEVKKLSLIPGFDLRKPQVKQRQLESAEQRAKNHARRALGYPLLR